MRNRRRHLPDFDDTLVVEYSEEDGCWVAHSLRTDQIGTGSSKIEALADVIRAVYQVCELAAEDETINYLRDASGEVQNLAKLLPAITPEELDEARDLAGRGMGEDTLARIRESTRSAQGRLQST